MAAIFNLNFLSRSDRHYFPLSEPGCHIEFLYGDRMAKENVCDCPCASVAKSINRLSSILGMVAGGYAVDRILDAYPELTREMVQAALEYAAAVIDEEQVIARG